MGPQQKVNAARESSATRYGVLWTADRLLRKITTRPRTKESLRALLRRLDPENAPGLIRTALWSEPELSLSLVATLPRGANALILGADEVLAQLEETLSPALRRELVESLLADVDRDALGRVVRRARKLYGEIGPLVDDLWRAVSSDPEVSDVEVRDV